MKTINRIKNYIEFVVFIMLRWGLPRYNNEERSLLFINTGELGDLIISSILLENPGIFERYKKVKFLIKDKYLELFKDHSSKVEFIGYNYNKYKYNPIYKIRFLKSIRKEKFYQVIHLTAARGILNEEITHLTNGAVVIALNSFWEYLGDHLGNYFDNKYDVILGKDIVNEYDKHYELIKYLIKDDNYNIQLNSNVTFRENNLGERYKSNLIIIAPLTADANRNWPYNYFKEVIEKLSKGYKIILLGSKEQKLRMQELGTGNNVKIIAGEYKLNELPQVFSKANLFIGLDSALTHLAIKFDVPLIAIIGGGEFGRFFPYKESGTRKYLYHNLECFLCHWKCTETEMFCMNKVNPAKVLEEANKILTNNYENKAKKNRQKNNFQHH